MHWEVPHASGHWDVAAHSTDGWNWLTGPQASSCWSQTLGTKAAGQPRTAEMEEEPSAPLGGEEWSPAAPSIPS